MVTGVTPIGFVSDSQLESKGFSRVESFSTKPQDVKTSKRVYVGDTWSITNTSLGKLDISFKKIKGGKAVLKVHSSNYGSSSPKLISIANKEFEVVGFDGQYDVTILCAGS